MIFKWCDLHVTSRMRWVPFTRGRECELGKTAVIREVHLHNCDRMETRGDFNILLKLPELSQMETGPKFIHVEIAFTLLSIL